MKRICIILLAVASFSCQEEVNLPLGRIDSPVPVIEAIWSDRPFYNEVKITLAQNYLDNSEIDVVKDAQVFIINTRSKEVIPFRFDQGNLSYIPVETTKRAEIGESYQLFIQWKDNQFTASGEMLAPPIVDSLTYKYKKERLFRDEGYYIKVYGKIPYQENNYYRIRVIENDTLKNDRDDYLLFDDTFGLTFFENGLELNYDFAEGDKVRLELYRLNKEPYNYFTQLVSLLYNDGGLFSPPPQNPDTNIEVISGSSDVLGYFSVASILTESVAIEGKDD